MTSHAGAELNWHGGLGVTALHSRGVRIKFQWNLMEIFGRIRIACSHDCSQ